MIKNFQLFCKSDSAKKILINSFIIFIIFAIIISDVNILFSIIGGMLVAQFSYKIACNLRKKFHIPISLSAIIIVYFLGMGIFSIIYYLVSFGASQTIDLLHILTDKNFLERKTYSLMHISEKIIKKISWFETQDFHMPQFLTEKIDILVEKIPEFLNQKITKFSYSLLEKSYVPGLKFIHLMYSICLFLIFSFFMICDWPKIIAIKHKLFGQYNEKIQKIIDSFKELIIKMLIGQLKVALILFVFYASLFFIVDFQYYLIFSFLFAIATLIPIIGSLFSVLFMLLSIYILEIPLNNSIVLVAIFGTGYILENLFLTPKMVGSSLDVHPMIVLIGLILFANIFGIIGVFFALPIIAFFTKIINIYLDDQKTIHDL